jgi:hypothetical protein
MAPPQPFPSWRVNHTSAGKLPGLPGAVSGTPAIPAPTTYSLNPCPFAHPRASKSSLACLILNAALALMDDLVQDPHACIQIRVPDTVSVERVWRAIESGVFYAASSTMSCSSCGYRAACRAWAG